LVSFSPKQVNKLPRSWSTSLWYPLTSLHFMGVLLCNINLPDVCILYTFIYRSVKSCSTFTVRRGSYWISYRSKKVATYCYLLYLRRKTQLGFVYAHATWGRRACRFVPVWMSIHGFLCCAQLQKYKCYLKPFNSKTGLHMNLHTWVF